MTTAPPLPPSMAFQTVTKGDGSKAQVVTLDDAARLMAVPLKSIEAWIKAGKVAICLTASREQRVLVESLWANVPEEFQRG